MKSNAEIHVVVFIMFFLLITCAPMTAFSAAQSSHHNHVALADHYENLAAEVQTKAQQQKEILKNN